MRTAVEVKRLYETRYMMAPICHESRLTSRELRIHHAIRITVIYSRDDFYRELFLNGKIGQDLRSTSSVTLNPRGRYSKMPGLGIFNDPRTRLERRSVQEILVSLSNFSLMQDVQKHQLVPGMCLG
jgi:hypothetical protein